VRRKSWQLRAVFVGAWVGLLFLLLPVLIAVPVSFTPNSYFEIPALAELSLVQYENVLTPIWLGSIGQSLVIGVGTTVLSCVLGTLSAIGLWRVASGYTNLLLGVMLMPLIVPPVVSALGMNSIWHILGLFDSYSGTVIAHTTWAAPFVVITVYTALSNVDRTLEKAARSLGAGPARTVWDVIIPGAMPGVLAGAVFAFITSWDEVVLTLFVTSREINTLPKQIFTAVRDNADPTVAAVASLLIAITLVAVTAKLVLSLRDTRPTSPLPAMD
jgi:putative spermidine/putrescine transport system permease protein